MENAKQRLTDFLSVPENEATFLNIEVVENHLKDTKGFIFPSYLQKNDVEGFNKTAALDAVISFFDKVLAIAGSDNSEDQKIHAMRELFAPVHEIKTTGLGYAHNSSQGYGPDYDALVKIGVLINKIVERFKETGSLDDLMVTKSLPLLAPNFGPDALSDLLSALIYPQLVEYTRFIFDKFDVDYEFSDAPEKIAGSKRQVWNAEKRSWEVYTYRLFVNGMPLTLVPYKFVIRNEHSLDPFRYVTVFLLENLRKKDDQLDANIKSIGRKRDYVQQKIGDVKKFALEETQKDLTSLTAFLQDPITNGRSSELDGPNAI